MKRVTLRNLGSRCASEERVDMIVVLPVLERDRKIGWEKETIKGVLRERGGSSNLYFASCDCFKLSRFWDD